MHGNFANRFALWRVPFWPGWLKGKQKEATHFRVPLFRHLSKWFQIRSLAGQLLPRMSFFLDLGWLDRWTHLIPHSGKLGLCFESLTFAGLDF